MNWGKEDGINSIALQRKADEHPQKQHLNQHKQSLIFFLLLSRNMFLNKCQADYIEHPTQKHDMGMSMQPIRKFDPWNRANKIPPKEKAKAGSQEKKQKWELNEFVHDTVHE